VSTIKVDTYLTRGGASEIAIDKLKGASSAASISVVAEGGSTTTNLQQGLAKSWVSFDGDTFGINDSFNVASMTDNGTGSYTVTFANDFANINYSSNVNCTDRGAVITVYYQGGDNAVGSHSFLTLIVSNTSGGGTNTDSNHCDVQYFGDLA